MFSARLSYSCCESGDKAAMKLMAGGHSSEIQRVTERPEPLAGDGSEEDCWMYSYDA